MKNKIFWLVILSIFICCNINAAEEPKNIPGENNTLPSGSTPTDLASSQSQKESMIATQQALADAAQTNFVTVNGTALSQNGLTYKFSLANQYYLIYKSQAMIDEIFSDAKAMGLNVIRTWGFCDGMYKDGVSFQPSAGVYDESGFRNMDYIIYKASQSGMKVIIPFVNNWDDFGGINQYVKWLTGTSPSNEEHDLFFTDPMIKGWYKDYVSYFINRVNTYTGISYKDDPTILAWELANEPRAYTDSSGTVLNPWINEMAQYVKSIDSNHLLSAGVEGWYGYKDTYGSNTGVDFVTSQSSPYLDIATFHLFPDYYNLSSTQALQWIEDRGTSAQNALNKPVYIGEFGKMVDRSAPDANTQMKNRNSLYKNIYTTAASSGVDGAGFWLLSGKQDNGTLYPDYDHFTVYYPEDRSTASVIKSGSSLFTPATNKGGGKKNNNASGLAELRMKQLKWAMDFYDRFGFLPKNLDSGIYIW